MLNKDEARLIQRARRGDRNALAALYQQHVQAIYRYISYRVPENAAADDLTAEVFLRMVEGLPSYHVNSTPFEAWLYRIASARVADYYRQQSRHPHEPLSETEPDRALSPEGTLQAAEEEAELRVALRRLSEDYQNVLLLRFVERKSHAEVAILLGKSVTAVKSIQHRALSNLAELLGSDGKVRHYLRGSDE